MCRLRTHKGGLIMITFKMQEIKIYYIIERCDNQEFYRYSFGVYLARKYIHSAFANM